MKISFNSEKDYREFIAILEEMEIEKFITLTAPNVVPIVLDIPHFKKHYMESVEEQMGLVFKMLRQNTKITLQDAFSTEFSLN